MNQQHDISMDQRGAEQGKENCCYQWHPDIAQENIPTKILKTGTEIQKFCGRGNITRRKQEYSKKNKKIQRRMKIYQGFWVYTVVNVDNQTKVHENCKRTSAKEKHRSIEIHTHTNTHTQSHTDTHPHTPHHNTQLERHQKITQRQKDTKEQKWTDIYAYFLCNDSISQDAEMRYLSFKMLFRNRLRWGVWFMSAFFLIPNLHFFNRSCSLSGLCTKAFSQ